LALYGGKILIVVGTLVAYFGALLLVSYLPLSYDCNDEEIRESNRYECREADDYSLLGIMAVSGGGFLVGFGYFMGIIEGRKVSEYMFTCPRCGVMITYQFARATKNCHKCGLPIDWSKAEILEE
jgi:ribosomal protein L37E